MAERSYKANVQEWLSTMKYTRALHKEVNTFLQELALGERDFNFKNQNEFDYISNLTRANELDTYVFYKGQSKETAQTRPVLIKIIQEIMNENIITMNHYASSTVSNWGLDKNLFNSMSETQLLNDENKTIFNKIKNYANNLEELERVKKVNDKLDLTMKILKEIEGK